MSVRWHNVASNKFGMKNGTRQGSLLSPYLFARYIRGLIFAVCNARIGCNIGSIFYNTLAYADDLVLLAPSWFALQELINLLQLEADKIGMPCKIKKTCCMVSSPVNRNRLIFLDTKCFTMSGSSLKFVSSFKYLGHIICNSRSDDNDTL